MKRIITDLLIVTILVLSLAACSSPADVTLSPSPAQTAVPSISPMTAVLPMTSVPQTPSLTSSPETTDAPSSSNTPLAPDSFIPGAEAEGNHIANSGDSIYDDEHYIYFSHEYSSDLFIIDKQNKTQQAVPYACRFTVCNGKVYYAGGLSGNYENEDPDLNYIKEYDPRTGETKNTTMNEISDSLLVYNDRLYYTLCIDPDSEGGFALFSVKLNGKGKQAVGPQSVWNFSITGDKVYYVDDGATDMPPIYEYDLKTCKAKKICPVSTLYYPFRISNNKLYYVNDEDGFIGAYDTETGEHAVIADGFYDFTLLGKYVLCASDALYAYDIDTQKTYDLMELGDYEFHLYSTEHNAYIAFFKEHSTELDRIVIRDGKASLEKAADIEGGTE